jgi:hypothetical protein
MLALAAWSARSINSSRCHPRRRTPRRGTCPQAYRYEHPLIPGRHGRGGPLPRSPHRSFRAELARYAPEATRAGIAQSPYGSAFDTRTPNGRHPATRAAHMHCPARRHFAPYRGQCFSAPWSLMFFWPRKPVLGHQLPPRRCRHHRVRVARILPPAPVCAARCGRMVSSERR